MLYYILIVLFLWYFGSILGAYLLTYNIPSLKKGRAIVPFLPFIAVAIFRTLLFDNSESVKNRLHYALNYLRTPNKYLVLLIVFVNSYEKNLAKHPQKSTKIDKEARIEAREEIPRNVALRLAKA